MAKPRPEKKKREPAERRVLPMELQLGDRLADETGEWEVIGRPYTGWERTPWHATQRAAWEALKKAETS
jgi:hypothetical protein